MTKHKSGNYEPVYALVKGVDLKDDFDVTALSSYQYEVIGGQHNVMSAKSLHKDFPDVEQFQGRFARVYVGLSDTEASWLGFRHNETGEYRHATTWKDMV
jgi:hypothetical protein